MVGMKDSMTNVMISVQTINEFQEKHPDDIELIDCGCIDVLRTNRGYFIKRRLRTL